MADKQPVSAHPMLGDAAMPAQWLSAREHLEDASVTYWLATVRPDGRPHVRPVLAVWVEGGLYFCAGGRTRKAKNLALESHCAVTVEREPLDLVVEGIAAKVREADKLRRVADAYASTYDWHVTVRDGAFHDAEGAPTAGPPPYDVYEVTPTTAFGFGTDESFSPTRWRFEERAPTDESDFDAIFGDDYLYFFAERLNDERSESDVDTITSLLALKAGDQVADVACGHGRISNRLARNGIAVKGLDAASHFLDIARSQAIEWNLDVSYEQGDMRQLPWAAASFDAVVSWTDSFGYFSEDENIRVLEKFSRVLRPGGRVLIETLNREFIVREMVPVSLKERGDNFLIDKYDFDSDSGRLETERLVARSGEVTRARHFWRLYTFTELRGILERLDFMGCEVYGEGGEDFTPTNPRMIVVATKT